MVMANSERHAGMIDLGADDDDPRHPVYQQSVIVLRGLGARRMGRASDTL